jgi:hypothetical protein
MAGWSLYLDVSGVPTYVYNCFGHDISVVRGGEPLAPGRHEIEMRYNPEGGFAAGGQIALSIDEEIVDESRVERTVPVVFSMSGETFDVGIDTGAQVGPYEHGFECTAEIHGVTLERLKNPDRDTRDRMRKGEQAAALRTQGLDSHSVVGAWRCSATRGGELNGVLCGSNEIGRRPGRATCRGCAAPFDDSHVVKG